jgi:signal peptidase I
MSAEPSVGALSNERKPLSWKRALIDCVLSILQPGLGHIYNRQLKTAIAYLVFTPIFLLVGHVGGYFHSFEGFAFFFVIQAGLLIFMIASSFWVGLRWNRETPPGQMNRLALTIALLLAAVNFAGAASGFNQKHLLGLRAYIMRANSMAPTIVDGDRVIADLIAYTRVAPKRGDLVLFTANAPARPLWIKRVIGLEGDTVVVSTRGVEVNGRLLDEPYIAKRSSNEGETDSGYGSFSVPTGQYFLMGDNRGFSLDSRYRQFGPIYLKQILGKPLFLYWSPDHSRVGRDLR